MLYEFLLYESAAAASRLRREADRAECEAREKVERLETETRAKDVTIATVTREKENAQRRVSQLEAETANADERAVSSRKRLDEYVAKLQTSTATLERLSKENEALAERLAFAEAKSASLLGAVAARDAASRDAETSGTPGNASRPLTSTKALIDLLDLFAELELFNTGNDGSDLLLGFLELRWWHHHCRRDAVAFRRVRLCGF